MTNVNLLDLLKQADSRSPEALLGYALPKISTELDDVDRIEVFRLARGGLVLWHSQNSPHADGTFIVLDTDALFQEALDTQAIVTNEDINQIVAPMLYQERVFALFVITFTSRQEAPSKLLSDIIDDLGLMLYTQQMQTLLRQQIEITGRLAVASSLPDVASIIAQTMTLKGQFIGVNVFEYDDKGALTGATVLATANREASYPANIPMGINFSALQELHTLLTKEGEVLVNDIASEDRFSEDARAWLKSQNVESLYLLPMWVDNQLYAFISLVDGSRALALSDIEKELYHNIVHQAGSSIEKQHLLEHSQQRASQSVEQVRILGLINELMALSSRDIDEKLVLQRMAEILLETTGSDHVGVVMQDGIEALVVSEAPDRGLVGQNVELGTDSVHSLLQETKSPLVVEDIATDAKMPQATREALLAINMLSIAILPMFDENNTIMGTVSLDYFTQQTQIDTGVVEIAQTIVSQMSLSIQKKRLLTDSQQQAQQLSKLTDFGQALRATLGLSDILRLTLKYCPNLMQVDYVGILIYDHKNNGLSPNAEYFNGTERIKMNADPITESQNSIALDSWTKHELVDIADLQNNWDVKHPYQRDLQGILALPLASSGMFLGVIEVGHQDGYFDENDINALRQIGTQLAIALSNSEVYAQSQRLARNKTRANEIIARLQEQLEVNDILAIVVQELGQAIGAKKGRIRLGSIPDEKGSAK
ncbi:MAG: hypothetical protein Phog2KO_06740 [Phototrophicaceae bacterium]